MEPDAKQLIKEYAKGLYILNGKTPTKAVDLIEWGHWYEKANRHVKLTTIKDVKISTVFLGLDHQFYGGKPLLFETMIFGGAFDEYQWRYHTWEDAEAGHERVCKAITEGEEP